MRLMRLMRHNIAKVFPLPFQKGEGQGEDSPKTFFAPGTPEPPEAGRAGCPHPAATVQSVPHARRRGEDTQPYLPAHGKGELCF